MVVLDTDVIIDYIRQPDNENVHLESLLRSISESELAIPVITIQELYVGESSKVRQKEEFFLALIGKFILLAYDDKTAKMAGEIMRDTRPRPQFADAAIAATAILNKAKLLTLNKKDFQGIKGLKLA